jgi:peptidoglycan/LPS O-acetylase OafA/YrhL
MRKVAVVSTWITFALCLYSTFWLVTRAPGAVGAHTLLPVVFLGGVLIAHHSKLVRPSVVWILTSVCAIVVLFGLLVVASSLALGEPTLGWGLAIGLFTIVPGISNAIVLYRRRGEWKPVQAAS